MMYFKRKTDAFLQKWRSEADRLPLIVRGARQVGKTEAIRHFAASCYQHIVELNFVEEPQYCLGLLLLDKKEPWKVIARSEKPFMSPAEEYELKRFYGNCIFVNGQIVDGDRLTIYYGASDTVVCGAELSIRELVRSLKLC